MSGKGGLLLSIALVALAAALFGFAGAWGWQASGVGRTATEQVVHDYILEHPEILPQAIERLQARELEGRVDPLRSALETPYPGAIMGNPKGSVTVVEFSDYACPYCRVSLPDIDALIAANPDLRIVMREYPILSPASADAAKMALAAAEQGRYSQFHKKMFELGPPNSHSIELAAREAGVDLDKAHAAIAAGKYDAELAGNSQMAEAIGFSGTPAWIIGKQAFSGAVGKDRLASAIAEAKES